MSGLSADRAAAILRSLRGGAVIVYGDLILDRYVWGSVERISPEAPVPVLRVHETTSRPGGAANVAVNLRALGAEPRLVGVVGTDEEGEALREALAQAGLDPAGVVPDPSRETTVKTRYIAHHQQMLRADRESAAPVSAGTAARIAEAVAAAARQAEGAIVSDYAKGAVVEEGIEALRRSGLPFFVDPKGRDYSRYRGARAITPNQGETAHAAGMDIRTEADLAEAARRLRAESGGAAILVTRGERGMALFDAEHEGARVPAVPREVYDVTGAGDTVLAVLALAALRGASLREAAILATAAAGVTIGHVGTSAPTAAEILESLEDLLEVLR